MICNNCYGEEYPYLFLCEKCNMGICLFCQQHIITKIGKMYEITFKHQRDCNEPA